MLLLREAYRCYSKIGLSHAKNREKNGPNKFILAIVITHNSDRRRTLNFTSTKKDQIPLRVRALEATS